MRSSLATYSQRMRPATSDADELTALRRTAAAKILAPLLENPHQVKVCEALRDHTFVALDGTRRAGKTEIFRWFLAALVLSDGYVVRVIAPQLSTPAQNWILREPGPPIEGKPRMLGGLELLHSVGLGGLFSHESPMSGLVKAIRFEWGSTMYIHPIDNLRAMDNKRGFRANFYWVDEAQALRLLGDILLQLVFPTLQDLGAHVLLSGTPSDQLDTLFGRTITQPRQDDGWARLKLASWYNPFMGADPQTRWRGTLQTFVEPAREQYELTDEQITFLRCLDVAALDRIQRRNYADPHEQAMIEGGECIACAQRHPPMHEDLRREVLGQWCQGGSHYVYLFHRMAPDQRYWCAISQEDADHAGYQGPVLTTLAERVAALPRPVSDWSVLVGFDLGFRPDPAAWVVLAWSEKHPTAFVLEVRKEWELDDDVMFERMARLIAELRELKLKVTNVVGDLTGQRTGTMVAWDRQLRTRFPGGIPIVLPKKHDKDQQIRVLNLDIVAPRVLFCCGDPLDFELLNLQRSPTTGKIQKDREVYDRHGRKQVPGDHAIDGLRYLGPYCGVLFAETPPKDPTLEDVQNEAVASVIRGLRAQRFGKT